MPFLGTGASLWIALLHSSSVAGSGSVPKQRAVAASDVAASRRPPSRSRTNAPVAGSAGRPPDPAVILRLFPVLHVVDGLHLLHMLGALGELQLHHVHGRWLIGGADLETLGLFDELSHGLPCLFAPAGSSP